MSANHTDIYSINIKRNIYMQHILWYGIGLNCNQRKKRKFLFLDHYFGFLAEKLCAFGFCLPLFFPKNPQWKWLHRLSIKTMRIKRHQCKTHVHAYHFRRVGSNKYSYVVLCNVCTNLFHYFHSQYLAVYFSLCNAICVVNVHFTQTRFRFQLVVDFVFLNNFHTFLSTINQTSIAN